MIAEIGVSKMEKGKKIMIAEIGVSKIKKGKQNCMIAKLGVPICGEGGEVAAHPSPSPRGKDDPQTAVLYFDSWPKEERCLVIPVKQVTGDQHVAGDGGGRS